MVVNAMMAYVEKPITWLNSKRDGDRHRLMYENLINSLGSIGVKIKEFKISYRKHNQPPNPPPFGFVLSYHSIGDTPYVWRIKETPIPYYYSIDRLGYSGWSELSMNSPMYFAHQERVEAVDQLYADVFCAEIRDWLISDNISKYAQSNIPHALPDRFVFYPLQVLSDPVRIHDRINALHVLSQAASCARFTRIPLVVKRHPYCRNYKVFVLLKWLSATNKFFIQSDVSVTQALPACQAVIVGNSGVGLEALAYGKDVYSFSKSEYDLAVERIEKSSDVQNAFMGRKVNSDIKSRFILYFLNRMCFDARSMPDIRQKIEKLADISRSQTWDSTW